MKFNAIRIHSAPEALVHNILEQIRDGHLKAGDCLPSQRELARMFEVGLGTVREALKILNVMGCVDVQRGKGSFVTEDALARHRENASIGNALEAVSLKELMKARKVVESGAARLAAVNADPECIQQLRDLKSRMTADGIDSQTYYENDVRFHIAVAEASGNQAIIEIVRLLVERTLHHKHFMNTALGVSMPESMGLCVKSASAVVDCIIGGDAAAAAQAMLDHLNTVNVRLFNESPARRMPTPPFPHRQTEKRANGSGARESDHDTTPEARTG